MDSNRSRRYYNTTTCMCDVLELARVPAAQLAGVPSGSSVLGMKLEKDGEMPRWTTTSDDISQCCQAEGYGPLNSLLWRRDSRLFAAPTRQERCASHEWWHPRCSLPLLYLCPTSALRPPPPSPPHVAGSHGRTRDCLRPHMRHSCRDVPSESLLTCKL